ncbi:MAG: response regulator [Planctomycetota bacterium]|jgi:CheY-like chemotaxis protein
MQKTIKPIDVLVGEANDGHAELVEASLWESGMVNSLYRGRDGTETLAFVRHAWRGGKDATDATPLILLDCRLPRVGGAGVLRVLKTDRRYSWIPIIAMTTAYNRQQAEQCRRLGCEAYITKWAVFLGLPGFVRKIRFLAGGSIWGNSRNPVVAGSHACRAGALARRCTPDATRIYAHRQERIGKEVKDGSTTP